MGSIVSFLGGGHAEALPPARADLADCLAEIVALEAQTAILVEMDHRLEKVYLARVDEAERERIGLIDHAAESLVARLHDGLKTSLASLSRQAESTSAQLAASTDQISIVRVARSKIADEVAALTDRHTELMASKPELIAAVVNEAAGECVRLEHEAAVDALREALVRKAAFDRVMRPERHDHVPPSRLIVTLPPTVWSDDPPQAIELAPPREIKAAEDVLRRFSVALESDALAKMEAFPSVDPTAPSDALFHELSPVERNEITRTATYTNRQRADALEPQGFIAAAKSALGL
jgi:hypothetical protein